MRSEAQEEVIPQLQIVPPKNGDKKANKSSAPLVLVTGLHKRPPRPELATLGWANRAARLAGRK
jgi:hypothetical protein